MSDMSTITPLNLDQSLPNNDAWRIQNLAGTVRWISTADARTIDVMNRVFGDIAWRDLLIQSTINQIINIITTSPSFTSFSDATFVKTDGSHALTGPLSSPSPVGATDLANKGYVDAGLSSLSGIIDNIATTLGNLQVLTPHQSAWVPWLWNTAGLSLDLPLATSISNPDNIVNIVVMERVNVGTHMSPQYCYRQLMHGTSNDGVRMDDCWISSVNAVRTLLPGTSSYTSWPESVQYNFTAAVERSLKAIVWETT